MSAFFRCFACAAMAILITGPIHAACYADYRAAMENPLRLHYGVIAVPEDQCSIVAAEHIIAPRIAVDGWVLLQVISVFDDTGLAERRQDAGAHYLRF